MGTSLTKGGGGVEKGKEWYCKVNRKNKGFQRTTAVIVTITSGLCMPSRQYIAHPICQLTIIEPITGMNHSALGQALKVTELLRLTNHVFIRFHYT